MAETLGLTELYEWVLRCQEEMSELEGAFPEALKADRSRLVMSFNCLRVSLEVRIKPKFPKRAGVAATDTSPRGTPPRL
jgi:hypothetical protein